MPSLHPRPLLRALPALLLLVGPAASSARSASDPLARSIVLASKEAIGNAKAVRFDVRDTDGYRVGLKGERRVDCVGSILILRRRPTKLVALLRGANGDVHARLGANGPRMLISAEGREFSRADRSSFGGAAALIGDFGVVARLFTDGRFHDDFVEKGSLMTAGTDLVDGDLCDILIHSRSEPERFATTITTLWFSRETHLPRGIETRVYFRGSRSHVERRFISNIELIDGIDEKVFEDNPKASDTVPFGPDPPPPSDRPALPTTSTNNRTPLDLAATPGLAPLLGRKIGSLQVVSPDRTEPVKLAEIIAGGSGTPERELTHFVLWAPWRFASVDELRTISKVEGRYPTKLRVVPIAIGTDPAQVRTFVARPDFPRFAHYVDPDWKSPGSTPLKSELLLKTLPLNVVVDKNGAVVDAWHGRTTLVEYEARLKKYLGTPKP